MKHETQRENCISHLGNTILRIALAHLSVHKPFLLLLILLSQKSLIPYTLYSRTKLDVVAFNFPINVPPSSHPLFCNGKPNSPVSQQSNRCGASQIAPLVIPASSRQTSATSPDRLDVELPPPSVTTSPLKFQAPRIAKLSPTGASSWCARLGYACGITSRSAASLDTRWQLVAADENISCSVCISDDGKDDAANFAGAAQLDVSSSFPAPPPSSSREEEFSET